ncbi:unnamed protein product [Linum tenue]|uniref:Uncharacterized protein n=1 Tax=Linum tenue TaxID=586396 RepID=A0AAV0LWK0_9ROSI|nr:unnamed protein product [Linum tenue]
MVFLSDRRNIRAAWFMITRLQRCKGQLKLSCATICSSLKPSIGVACRSSLEELEFALPFFTFKDESRKMARETSPGLKILWIWTIGTAAVLVTSVVRTRMRDMEQFMNAEQQQPHLNQQQEPQEASSGESIVLDDSPPPNPSDGIVEEIKSL